MGNRSVDEFATLRINLQVRDTFFCSWKVISGVVIDREQRDRKIGFLSFFDENIFEMSE